MRRILPRSALSDEPRSPQRHVVRRGWLALFPLALSLAFCLACTEEEPPSPRERETSRLKRILAMDQALPEPPLQAGSSYQPPEGRAEWIERLGDKLQAARTPQALKFAKEALASLGAESVERVARILDETLRRPELFAVTSNAVETLARTEVDEAAPHLLRALEHPTPMIRMQALKGLQHLRDPAILEHLAARVEALDEDPRPRQATESVLTALCQVGAPGAGAIGLELKVRAERRQKRRHTRTTPEEATLMIRILMPYEDRRVLDLMEQMLRDDTNQGLHAAIVDALILHPDTRGARRVLRLAVDLPGRRERGFAFPRARRALAMLGDEEMIVEVERSAEDSDPQVRTSAIVTLALAGRFEAAERAFADPDPKLRAAAIDALDRGFRRRAGLYPPEERPKAPLTIPIEKHWTDKISQALEDESAVVRLQAARLSSLIGRHDLLDPLRRTLVSADLRAASAALDILVHPEVQDVGTVDVILGRIADLPVPNQRKFLQAACILAQPEHFDRLVAYLDNEEPWGTRPCGDQAAVFLGQLGREVIPKLLSRYRDDAPLRMRERIILAVLGAIGRESRTGTVQLQRWTESLSPGARFLIETALEDYEITFQLHQRLLMEAPLYCGTAGAAALWNRAHHSEMGVRERGWTLLKLKDFF